MTYDLSSLVLMIDLAGTFVFAVEGATAAVKGDLDLIGIMVLSFVTALGGGIIRDVLIGAVPPQSIRDWRYGAIAFTGGAAVILFHHSIQRFPYLAVVGLDAAGLSLFAVSGAGKAVTYKINPFIAVLMGGITGVGGGILRDVLLAQIPTVLRIEIYAVAALAGSALMILGLWLRLPRTLMTLLGAITCFVLRMVSVWQHWNLPRMGR